MLALAMILSICATSASCDCNCCRSLALTQVSGRGIALLNASHPGRLRQLRLDGCRLSMGAVASTLWRQPKVGFDPDALPDDRRRGETCFATARAPFTFGA